MPGHDPRALGAPRPTASLGLLVLAAALALGLAGGVSSAVAAPYKTCKLTEREQFPRGGKPTYNLTLKQQRTSCRTAKKVAAAFHRCRSRTSYRCTKRLLARWRCNGRRDSRIATQFYGSFVCKSGARRVRGSYQQNT